MVLASEVPVKKFGQKLRQLRNEKKLSQRALAQKINVSFGMIQLYEKRNAIPSADIVGRIAKLFEISTDFLIFDDVDALEKVQDRDLVTCFAKADQLHHRDKFLIKELIDGLASRNELERQLQEFTPQQKPARSSRRAA